MNDQQKYIGKLMASMSQGYPSYKLTEEGIIWYASILEDIQDNEAIAAAAKFICSFDGQFMPSPGMWRQRAFDIMLAKKNLPSAYEAWEEVLRMGDGSPEKHCKPLPDDPNQHYVETIEKSWKHPLIETVAMRCGWPIFPDPESLSYDRDTFIKAYNDHVRREDEEMRTPELVKKVEQKYIDAGDKIKSLAAGMGVK
jgi:hypothetical protein